MKFRTTFTITPLPTLMSHPQRMLLVGSCFTSHIGQRLANGQFEVILNPFGTIYNPVSLAKCLTFDAHEAELNRFLFKHQGLWRHWDTHSTLARPDREAALSAIQAAADSVRRFAVTADWLIITLGSAHVYEWQPTGQIVANCHKISAAQFHERLLSVTETVAALRHAIETIRQQNPDLQVLLTVSPVRHLQRGAVNNTRSKAVLTLACAELTDKLHDTYYFPAYELLHDDLRDYRFYESDLIHPSAMAIDYIWEQFNSACISPKTQQHIARIAKVKAGFAHRPFNADTPEHQAFLAKLYAEAAELGLTPLPPLH
jgi:GSCFA family